jgi:uncharacterized protein
MKLYAGKIPSLSTQLVKELVAQHMISVERESVPEVELDIGAVLKEFVRMDMDVNDKSKEIMERQGLEQAMFNRIRRGVAKDAGFPSDDPMMYIINQIIESLMHSHHVDEVFGEDHDLRKTMKPVFQKLLADTEELDKEVRNRIKNVTEGTQSWDIEYQKMMAQIKKTKGFE